MQETMIQLKPQPGYSRTEARGEHYKQRNAIICSEYKQLTEQYPTAKRYRIIDTLADRHQLSTPRVREIVIKGGLYIPKTHRP